MTRAWAALLLFAAACEPALLRRPDGFHAQQRSGREAPYLLLPLEGGAAMPAEWEFVYDWSAYDFAFRRKRDGVRSVAVTRSLRPRREFEEKSPREHRERLTSESARLEALRGRSFPRSRTDDEGRPFEAAGGSGWEVTSRFFASAPPGSKDGPPLDLRVYTAVVRSARDGTIVEVVYRAPTETFESGLPEVQSLARRISF